MIVVNSNYLNRKFKNLQVVFELARGYNQHGHRPFQWNVQFQLRTYPLVPNSTRELLNE